MHQATNLTSALCVITYADITVLEMYMYRRPISLFLEHMKHAMRRNIMI